MARANFKIAVLIVALLNLGLLWPLLHCRYNHDDLMSSCATGIAAAHNESVWGLTLRTIAEWTVLRGRFFPLAFYHFLFFSVVRSLLVYRILSIACILGNVFLFALLVGRLTASRRIGLLAGLMAPLAFQFRLFHDPILSFCLLLPITCMLILGSLVLLDLHLERKRRWQLAVSISLYVLAILMYEVAWPFFLVHYLLIRLRRAPGEAGLPKRRSARPFFVVAGFFVLLTLGVRLVFNVPLFNKDPHQAHLPYAPHLDAGSSVQNFAKQTLAAVPFSYRWFVLRGATVPPVQTPVMVLLILGVGYPFAAWLTLGRFHDPAATLAKIALPGLCLLGSAILILPATLISLSAEHFRDASWGVGYLPVYISYFGATLLLLAGVVGVMRLVRGVRLLRMPLYPAAAVGVGGLLGLAAIVSFSDNARVVERFNVASGAYHREVTQEALQHGLCRDLPQNAHVWLSNRWRWEHEDLTVPFFRTYAGTPVKVVSDGKYRAQRNAETTVGAFQEVYCEADRVFYLSHEASTPGEGFTVLANLTFVAGDRTGMRAATGQHVRIYVRVPRQYRHLVVRGRTLGSSPGEPQVPFILDQNNLKFMVRGRRWCIVELPLRDTEIDLLSIQASATEDR